MGLRTRRVENGAAFAAAVGLSDTRKGSAMAWIVRRGSITLVSGAATITDASFNANTVVDLYMVTPGGTLGAQYKQTVATDVVTIQAISLAGASVTTDTSTLSYIARTPCFHGDQSPLGQSDDLNQPSPTYLTVTAATAVDLPSTIALANNIRQVLNQHMGDAISHLVADATNPVTAAVAVDLPSVETLLNACQTAFNAHLTQSGVHIFNDTVNTNSTATATNLSTAEALANALATAINAHMGSSHRGESVTIDNA